MVAINGPCEFQLVGVNSGRLAGGYLTAHVPTAAVGFTVTAPHGVRVTDLGTQFEMRVSGAGRHVDTWVRQGTVQIQSLRMKMRLLGAGQRISLIDGDVVQPLLVSAEASNGHAYSIARGGFVEDALAYSDRNFTWVGLDDPTLPAVLRGADYVQPPNADKADANLSLTLKLSAPATLWVLWNPNAPLPDWLIDEFESTSHHITLMVPATRHPRVLESRTLDYTLWRRRIDAAGDVTLGARQIPDRPSPAGMYGIIVTEPDRPHASRADK